MYSDNYHKLPFPSLLLPYLQKRRSNFYFESIDTFKHINKLTQYPYKKQRNTGSTRSVAIAKTYNTFYLSL